MRITLSIRSIAYHYEEPDLVDIDVPMTQQKCHNQPATEQTDDVKTMMLQKPYYVRSPNYQHVMTKHFISVVQIVNTR
jgi:hypothetical protein